MADDFFNFRRKNPTTVNKCFMKKNKRCSNKYFMKIICFIGMQLWHDALSLDVMTEQLQCFFFSHLLQLHKPLIRTIDLLTLKYVSVE